jgi:hypothetical protein
MKGVLLANHRKRDYGNVHVGSYKIGNNGFRQGIYPSTPKLMTAKIIHRTRLSPTWTLLGAESILIGTEDSISSD